MGHRLQQFLPFGRIIDLGDVSATDTGNSIFAVTLRSPFKLTMMFVGLMSRWTRFCLCTAANQAATCDAIPASALPQAGLSV
jgi:hypothetical protein